MRNRRTMQRKSPMTFLAVGYYALRIASCNDESKPSNVAFHTLGGKLHRTNHVAV